MESKYVLIPWSGGLDSTYSVLYYLKLGYIVHAPYYVIQNNKNKIKQERITINKLKRLEPFKTAISDQRLVVSIESAVDILTTDDSIYSLSQPPIWLLCSFYMLKNKYKYEKLIISYVLNDCAISYIDDLKNLWDSLKGFIHDNCLDYYPPLDFPLKKYSKTKLVSEYINNNHVRVLNSVWWCESPINGMICKKCGPCLRYGKLEWFKDKFKNKR